MRKPQPKYRFFVIISIALFTTGCNEGTQTNKLENTTHQVTPVSTPPMTPTPKPTPIPPPKTVAPKPAPKSGCDPNYSGCVPIASDVDCAGGSGNGPAYVQGPIRVIGTDIYDLDRDGDGIACE